MTLCSFAEGAAMFDVTPIENMFLQEHLYDAPGAALKVYLYARMAALHPELCGDLEELGRALRLDEDQVRDAFDYWERRGLVRRVGDNPPAYELLPLFGQGEGASGDSRMYAYRDFHNRLQALFGESMIADHEFRKAADWLNILGFEQAAVVRLVAYGIRKSRSKSPKPATVFKNMDDVAERWSRLGIRSLEDVERAIADEEGVASIARAVLRQLGMGARQPSVPELESVRRWVREWGFDEAQILEACAETTKARSPSFGYLEGILARRREGADQLRGPLIELLRELRPASPQPSPEDERRYRALLEAGFPAEMVQLAAVQCHQMNRHAFDDLEWRLNLWRDEGLATAAQADAYTREMAGLARQLRAVFKRAGCPDRRPGPEDIRRYRGWRERYPEALIGYAAECSGRAGGSMDYMEKLLDRWHAAGADTLEAARAEHEAWRAGNAAQAGTGAAANPALDYSQREYRDEDFGKDFYFDFDKEFGDKEEKA